MAPISAWLALGRPRMSQIHALEMPLVDRGTSENIDKQLEYDGSEAVVRSGVQVVLWNAL